MNSIPAKGLRLRTFGFRLVAGLFLVALAVSAVAVPQLRLLHLLQAFIYVAIVILARRNNVFALGAGFTIAVAWNCLEFFGPRPHPGGCGPALDFSAYGSGAAR